MFPICIYLVGVRQMRCNHPRRITSLALDGRENLVGSVVRRMGLRLHIAVTWHCRTEILVDISVIIVILRVLLLIQLLHITPR